MAGNGLQRHDVQYPAASHADTDDADEESNGRAVWEGWMAMGGASPI